MNRPLFLIAAFVLAAMTATAQTVNDLKVQSGDTVHAFTVEIADTPELIALGLMNRETMAESAGMLFDFGAPRPASMWMQNTLLSLDMLFIDPTGRVLAIAHNAAPDSERRIGIGIPVKAVLELNANTTNTLSIQPGDTVIHPLFNNVDTNEAVAE